MRMLFGALSRTKIDCPTIPPGGETQKGKYQKLKFRSEHKLNQRPLVLFESVLPLYQN